MAGIAGDEADVDALATELYEQLQDKTLIDTARMSSIFSGIKALSDKALDTFMRTSATMGPTVIEAHAARDWISLHSLAHRIKGASGYIAGERVNAAAHELQKCVSRLMPAEEHSSVAQAASSFLSEADRSAASEVDMPSETLAAARVKVLLRCLDELAIEIAENHRRPA